MRQVETQVLGVSDRCVSINTTRLDETRGYGNGYGTDLRGGVGKENGNLSKSEKSQVEETLCMD